MKQKTNQYIPAWSMVAWGGTGGGGSGGAVRREERTAAARSNVGRTVGVRERAEACTYK